VEAGMVDIFGCGLDLDILMKQNFGKTCED
jgi:hypothetical protein